AFTVRVDATSGTVTNANYTIEGTSLPPRSGPPVSTTITEGCPEIALSPSTLPGGAVGSFYEASITASGGTPSYAFSVVSGSLPPGLELSSSTIADLPIVVANLSGTPTAAGTFTFRIRAVDANGCAGSRTYTIVVESSGGCATLALSPSVLFDGFVGTEYRRTIRGVGGTAPYRFSVTSGSLPPGLTLSPGGVVSGTPTAIGTFNFRVRVVDSNECAASQSYTVTISCPPVALSPVTLPPAAQGVPYNQTITALGRHGPYTLSVTGGALPSGLTLLPSGSFSGAAAEVGTFSFTVTVTDANGCTGAQSYTLTVCAALTLSPAALPGATVGVSYAQAIAASGGTGPYTYAQTGLPSPMTLSPTTGLLSGTPTATGVFNVTVTATDANGCSGAQTYVLTVCLNLTLSPAFFPQGSAGTFYIQTLVASGGTPPYLYTAVGLPSFFTVSETTGVLSGTAPTAGAINFTATATDANGCSVSRGYQIDFTDAPPVIADLTLSPAGPDGFTLSIAGTGFIEGAVVIINGVTYPAAFVSPTLLTVALPASAIPATGSITVTVRNPGMSGGTSNPANLAFCDPPGAPLDPTIEPSGNPTGPVTGTDFLRVRWQPPASGPAPASYEFRINGDPYTVVVGATGAVVPPRGSNDPMTLFVRAHCNPDVAGPEVASPTYSLAPPVADFTFSAARVGSPVNFTDTSSPQATSWLWIFDDGATSTLQSPTHTFPTAGTHPVALIASNGSGSSQVIKEIAVSASTSGGGAVTSSVRAFETADGGRWSLPGVKLAGSRHSWLALTSSETEETIVYLRLLDRAGLVVLERRLAIAPGQPAINDVGAYGVEGTHTLEIVSSRPIVASLSQPDKQPSFGEGLR
ncbi:MAG TPA: putative Ig domain-containing protein, partial [Thermoanaerobaculia bacterium]